MKAGTWYIIVFALMLARPIRAQFNENIYHNRNNSNLTDQAKGLDFYLTELAKQKSRGSVSDLESTLLQIANLYSAVNDHHSAVKYYQELLAIHAGKKDENQSGQVLMRISDEYRAMSDYPRLLEYLQKARRAFEKAGNEPALAKTIRSTGYYYLNLPHFPTAIAYFLTAFDMYSKLGMSREVALLLNDLAHSYLLVKDSANAWLHVTKALEMNRKAGDQLGMAKNFAIMGDYHYKITGNIPKALEYLELSRDLYSAANSRVGVAQVIMNIADIYINTPDSSLEEAGIPASEKYTRSIMLLNNTLEIFTDHLPESEQLHVLYLLSYSYELNGKTDSAFVYYRKFVGLREKVVGTEQQKGIARLETRFEFEKKQDSLKLQKELSDEQLQKQFLLFRQQKQQLKLNRSQLDLRNSEIEIQKLAYQKMQVELTNVQLIKLQDERERQIQEIRVNNLIQEKAISELNQQRQWIYIIGGFLLLALCSVYLIYRSRLKSVRLKSELQNEISEQEKKESEFQHRLADISMSALRSQMNPHFIFNCLNSIKLYTTQNDTEAASVYLTKFSRLIRLVLENSKNERITLTSELAALELYIQLEAMRFKEKLRYTIEIDKNVETDYIEIPPLLLQPYVENAIWHGLMPRETGGKINIGVSLNEETAILEIDIVDNGIGRNAAAVIKNKSAPKHRSYGMKATTERVALINQIYKTGANVIVSDLTDEAGQANGTHVKLQIPV